MQHPGYQRAIILHQQGRHADAANELRAALANDPHDPYCHAMLALCLSDLQKHAEATQEAAAAIGLAPQMPLAHYAMAHVMFNREFLDDAARAIQEAVSLDPFNAGFHGLHAAICFKQRKWHATLEAAERGLQVDPEDATCVNLRAMALVQLGRKQEAAATIDGALEKNPENAVAHANQGWTYLHRGDPTRAMQHFREALRLDPTSEWAQMGMVEALKARNFLYRWLLAWFLFMGRLNQRAQFGIIVGGYIGYRLALNTARSNPNLAPYLWPVVIAYVGFAALTWLADPLANLALRLHPQGKYALTRDQRRGATCVGVILLGVLIAGGVWLFNRSDPAGLMAILLALFIMPMSGVFRAATGWPRWTMFAITSLLATLLVACFLVNLLMLQQPDPPRLAVGLFNLLLSAYSFGVLVTAIGMGWLLSVRPRR